jgi:hypothetical protein
MKQNTFVVLAVFCFAFLTYVFSGGLALQFWQSIIGFFVCFLFWLMILAPALKINKK